MPHRIRAVLALCIGCAAAPVAAAELIERLITFQVQSTLERIDFANSDLYFRFSGPMYATVTDPLTGRIAATRGPQLGRFDGALVRFHIDLNKALNDGDFFSFSCSECQITFNDGSVLKPIQPPDSEFDIPLEGRGLAMLGPVLFDGLGIQVRGAGCGGTQEVAGKGALAHGKGAICMNGTFTLPGLPGMLGELLAFMNFSVLSGQSDCTIILHVPQEN